MNKVCVVCGKELAGRQTKLCSDRECYREWKKERGREYRQNNPEKVKEQQHKYRRNNLEKIKECNRKYHQNNLEKIKEHKRKYYQGNQEREKERSRLYYLNNHERMKRQKRENYQNNAERKKARSRANYRHSRGLPKDWDLSRESSIEVIMKRWLQDSDIAFVEQYYINLEGINYTKVDFFIEPNICLYCDGDYWHGPERPDIQERDTEQDRVLASMGYSVIRMTETVILAGARPIEILEIIQ